MEGLEEGVGMEEQLTDRRIQWSRITLHALYLTLVVTHIVPYIHIVIIILMIRQIGVIRSVYWLSELHYLLSSFYTAEGGYSSQRKKILLQSLHQ